MVYKKYMSALAPCTKVVYTNYITLVPSCAYCEPFFYLLLVTPRVNVVSMGSWPLGITEGIM